MSSTLPPKYNILTNSSVELCSICPGLHLKKPERYFGLFVTEKGPTVLFKWASLPESDGWVQDLLHVVAKESSSPEESIFALYCLTWLHKNRSLSQRKGFEESKDISVMGNLSFEFKNLAEGRYKGTEELDKLMLGLDQSAKLFVRLHGSHYKGLKDMAYSSREDPQFEMEDTEAEQETSSLDKTFLKEFLVDRFVMLDLSQCVAGN